MLYKATICVSFFKAEYYSSECTCYIFLNIHKYFCCFHLSLAFLNNALWISLCKYLLRIPLWFALVICCPVGWLDHMVMWFTTLWGASILFSMAIASHTFPLAVHRGSSLSSSFPARVRFFCLCLIVGSEQVRGDDSLFELYFSNE